MWEEGGHCWVSDNAGHTVRDVLSLSLSLSLLFSPGVGHDPFRRLRVGQEADGIRRTTDLKGTDLLEVFTLQGRRRRVARSQ